MYNSKNTSVQFQNKKLREILFALGDLVFLVDKNYIISQYFQNRDNELLFTPPSMFVGKHLSEIGLSDGDLRAFILSINESKSEGRTPEFEFKLQIDGKEEFYIATASALKDESGQLVETFFISKNITEKKKSEIKLQELALIGARTTDLTIITDPYCKIVWVNQAFVDHTGYKLIEVIGKNPGTFLHGLETSLETISKVDDAVKNRISYQDIIINYKKNGDKYWVDFRIDPVFDEVGMCSHFISIERDVSKRKQFDDELATTRQYLLETNRVGKVGGWNFDVAKNIVYWTEVTREIHELPSDFEPTVEKVIQFYKEGHSREKYFELGTNAIRYGIPYDVELQIVTAKGKEIWVRAIGNVDFKDGVCTRLYGTFQDIDSFKKVENELLESCTLLKNLTNHVPACLYQYELNSDGSFALPYVSEGIYAISEVTSEEVKNRPALIFEMIHPDDLLKVQSSIDVSYQTVEKWTCDYRIITASKKEKWVRGISNPQRFGDLVKWYGFLEIINSNEARN